MKNLKNLLRAAALLAVTVSAAGCYTVDANLPGTLRGDIKADQTETVGKVNIEKGNWYFFWGLTGAPANDFFSAELKQQVKAKGGDGVANLTYESQEGCFDLFIGSITGGCIGPRSFKLTGDIVRIKTSPLPGKSLAAADTPADPARVAQAY